MRSWLIKVATWFSKSELKVGEQPGSPVAEGVRVGVDVLVGAGVFD